ncbi:MAG: hypothetical protein ACTSW4_06980 [Candidatus Ranarchaeia archaeon]
MSKIDVTTKPMVPLEIESLPDILRLVLTWASHQRSINLFYFKKGSRHILGAWQVVPAYFSLRGLPFFAYVNLDKKPEGSFIRYRLEPHEEWSWCDDASDRKYQYIPVVQIRKVPPIFDEIK